MGDPCYRAPELLLGATQYSNAIDLWSLGCLIIEIYYGLKLFYGKQNMEILANIIKVIGTPSSDDLIKMKAPINQIKMPVVKRMGFAVQVQRFKNNDGLPDLLEGLLNYNPEQRTSAFELLVHPFFQEIKHQSIRMNQASVPNLFNFTKEELNLPMYNDNLYKLVPDWFKQKQKRNEYLQINYEDALLILKN